MRSFVLVFFFLFLRSVFCLQRSNLVVFKPKIWCYLYLFFFNINTPGDSFL